jgi:hypothetical protein
MTGVQVKCRVVDVGCRLADDLKEFSHKAEAVSSGVKQSFDISRSLDLTLGEHQEA